MDDGKGGQYTVIYDGSFLPGKNFFLITGLTNGLKYSFKVHAVNFNGLSPASPISSFYACTAPTGFTAAPFMVSQSVTAIVIQWSPPKDNGGCLITGYAVYRDEGMPTVAGTGVITPISTEVNSVNDANVRDKPTLTQLQVTNFPANTDGFIFRFQIKVFTQGQRIALSGVAFISKATVPAKPSDRPVSDPSVTNDKRIKVDFATPVPDNSGSPILSYELQMDNGLAGPFMSLVGFNSNSMQTTYTVSQGVVKGRQHRFRYRARNFVGWGPFSDVSAVLAATVPVAPLKPLFVTFSGNLLTMTIQ